MPILPASATDIPEITILINSAYRGESAKQGWTNESELLEGVRVDEEEMQGYLGKDHIYLLKYTNAEDQIIGFVFLEKLQSNKLYLGMLTVKPDLQTVGIGRQLLAAGREKAEELGCTAVKISVIDSRHELIAWYERRGFKATGKSIPLVTDKSTSKEPLTLMYMEAPVGTKDEG